ncbi:hypothetical protein D3C76_1678500 [compost metagenome]
MAYLRQQVLQHLRPVAVVNHHFDQRCAGFAPRRIQSALQLRPVGRALIAEAEHRRRMLKLHVLRHQIEAFTLTLGRRQQGENLSAVIVDHQQNKGCRGLA